MRLSVQPLDGTDSHVMSSRYFDEWQVRDRIQDPIRPTVTATDKLLISTMAHNLQALHIHVEAGKATECGQILVNGTFTFALMVGLKAGETPLGTLVADLDYNGRVVPKPVFIGDKKRATSEVIELKDSKSRLTAGIGTFPQELINQRDEVACCSSRSALLQRTQA